MANGVSCYLWHLLVSDAPAVPWAKEMKVVLSAELCCQSVQLYLVS